jgi:hypothetical protein
LVSWCILFPEDWCCFCCDGCFWCLWSELQRAAINDRSGVVYFEENCCVHIRCRDTCSLSRYLATDNFFCLHYSGLSVAMSKYINLAS